MEQNRKVNTEQRRVKIEIEIPMIYHEALFNNPMIDDDKLQQRIRTELVNVIGRMYHNRRILPDAVRRYFEAKYGIPVEGVSKARKKARLLAGAAVEDAEAEALQQESEAKNI